MIKIVTMPSLLYRIYLRELMKILRCRELCDIKGVGCLKASREVLLNLIAQGLKVKNDNKNN